jgi:hypothetical protein
MYHAVYRRMAVMGRELPCLRSAKSTHSLDMNFTMASNTSIAPF